MGNCWYVFFLFIIGVMGIESTKHESDTLNAYVMLYAAVMIWAIHCESNKE